MTTDIIQVIGVSIMAVSTLAMFFTDGALVFEAASQLALIGMVIFALGVML